MLVERPEVAVFEKERMRLFELLEKHGGRFRKPNREVLVIRFEKSPSDVRISLISSSSLYFFITANNTTNLLENFFEITRLFLFYVNLL